MKSEKRTWLLFLLALIDATTIGTTIFARESSGLFSCCRAAIQRPAGGGSTSMERSGTRTAAEFDPTEETRNRFRLRRISEFADYELRVDPWRVFDRVLDEVVTIELIGQKKGNVLLIGGKEFKL
jgi:hypothetical protein